MEAKTEMMDAERKMEYANVWDNFKQQVEGMAEWSVASGKKLLHETFKDWNEFEMDVDKTV